MGKLPGIQNSKNVNLFIHMCNVKKTWIITMKETIEKKKTTGLQSNRKIPALKHNNVILNSLLKKVLKELSLQFYENMELLDFFANLNFFLKPVEHFEIVVLRKDIINRLWQILALLPNQNFQGQMGYT
jgi:hypothetical protein